MVLSLMCSVVSLSAIAQTDSDKPMSAKSLAALITELKEVVSKNAPDQKDAALVAEKWDKRQDLAGKTKSAVINLLFQDVRAVIKDSGVHYQIYSIFAFYKRIPDETPSVKTEKTEVGKSKPKAVERLTAITFGNHPYALIEQELAKYPGTKDIKEEEERVRKSTFEGFDEALQVNTKLTADQKAFVRANFDQIFKLTDKITEEAIRKNFPTEEWIIDGLDRAFAKNFTLKELNTLIVYLDSDQGQQVLKYVRQTNIEQMITGNGGKLTITEADKAEHDKFVATPLGKRFMKAYLKDTIAYVDAKNNEVRSKDPNADGFAIYEKESLNNLFNKFVADNYKK
jgi:hypothetical protein